MNQLQKSYCRKLKLEIVNFIIFIVIINFNIIIVIMITIITTEVRHSKTTLENYLQIKPELAVWDFKNLS